ncbi:PTS system cellobiose-specific IIA component [Scopulibacillus darangshiensis]|uniref:PTS system cellobiose-specific IIA component n=1 Tax=Scopulibacillus darangshiensis TaxID=442528 RepID=A0A4R2NIQ7_9BACL|nr:PTS lactose/cellobiose transporter subunit IIA [Scopulibacillus darangshiensis]TCP21178.1 PTS system cellobiose-specific IIA component [Scopulibacillus darangshiensis]
MEDQMPVAFQIILSGGNARSAALEAIGFARKGDFAEAENSLKLSQKEISAAHHIQTNLLQEEAGENHVDISLILVHAQDHLMNAITVKELAEEFIHLYKKL